MFPSQVALVSELPQVHSTELNRVAAALQKQVTHDFGPIWNIQGTVDAFHSLDDVPLDYWPIILVTDIPGPALGGHQDEQGQPFALVKHSDSWSLTASHECLEMLADPFGNRLIAGPSPKEDQGQVAFLAEVCDPSESPEYAYCVNDVLVSDFYTPYYFDPVQSSGVQYSFTGAITEPRQVLPGGYLSWQNPMDGHWWQNRYFGPAQEFFDLGIFESRSGSIRETIDNATPLSSFVQGLSAGNRQLQAAQRAWNDTTQKSAARANRLRQQINVFKSDN